MSKTCRTCGEEKPLADFYRDLRKADGLEARCKSCCVQRSTEYTRRRKFGVDGEEYAARLAAQGDACVVCLGASGAKRALAVDHDHETGEVRALLCGKCNTALGSLDEDVERMENLIHYVKTWSAG